MLGFCVPVPSLNGRSASLRILPECAAGRFLKHLIWRILLVIRRPVSGVESIFLPGLREGRSKPAGLVDEVAQRLAGEEAAAVVEDDLVAPVVEIGAVACRCAVSAAPPEGSTACGRRAAAPARRRRGRRRRSSSAPPLQGGHGHASGLQLADLPPVQLAKLDALLIPDPAFAATPLAWLRNAPTAPKPDHVRALLDRLRRVREIGVPPEAAGRIHEDRFQQLIREARISNAHQMGRYTVQRRRAILVASVIDLETRLTDAALDMADKLIGGLFARARKARERRYVVGTKNVGRLMRLFHDTIEALGAALNSERDAFTVVDENRRLGEIAARPGRGESTG
jgi:hypothetical protein